MKRIYIIDKKEIYYEKKYIIIGVILLYLFRFCIPINIPGPFIGYRIEKGFGFTVGFSEDGVLHFNKSLVVENLIETIERLNTPKEKNFKDFVGSMKENLREMEIK